MSPTDIANLALQLLGEIPINSLEDSNDKTSRTMRLNYAQVRDEVLQSARWNCAKKQEALARITDPEPIYKWSAAYQLPNDFLRLSEIEGEDAWVPKEFFDIHGKTLLIGRDDEIDDLPDVLNIEYICRLEDSILFDPLLIEAISVKLAAKTGRILTGSDQVAADMLRQYEQIVMPRAAAINAQMVSSIYNNNHRKFIRNSLLTRARRTTDSV